MKKIIIAAAIFLLFCLGGAFWVVSNARSSTDDMKKSQLMTVKEAGDFIFKMNAEKVAKTKDGELVVNPAAWGMATFDQKKIITYAAAVRSSNGTDPLWFRMKVTDSMDGQELASWGISGFKLNTK
ncbi:MAG: hypothetical protein DRJ65_00200 [Acidobacteria bacterium]|nr:MAG: hypothetical protein DRJ65_00200 [Acidobacteriota bacterium]